jgi:TP901 family phage tail tape measure protein
VSTVANIAINLDSRGVPAKLKQIADRGKEVDRSLNSVAAATTKAGREIKTAANGMRYFTDAAGRARKVNGQFVTSTEAAAAGIKKQDTAIAGAAAKFKQLGSALNSALGPIGLALSGLAGLGAAFQTLQQQDFAEAKVKTLGTNSEQLVTQLKEVSKELKGQASVTELTAAAYDVASAGFVNAADAANVLKAASLGAVGGFSDINTVGNAATSVLNAYEMSAANATSVVDKFIQTQNDGKIVVAEYAQNIGKVASAAAGLGIPLEEVNAVIAQSTASGVQADVAFTGLKGALARLASGEATNALKGLGIDISAASLESDGLLGTLQKLQGLDTGQIFKALGTEAGPALLPVLNNLERYEELINRQKDSAGAAAQAQAQAADTIQGALKRLQTAFQNAFADQSSLGKALKAIFLGAAVTVEALASAFDLIIAPIEAVSAATGAFGKAIADALGIDSQQQMQSFEEGWQSIRSGIETASNVIAAFGQATGQLLADLTITAFQFGQDLIAAFEGPINAITGFWQQFSRFVVSSWNNAATSVNTTASNLWTSISGGVRGIIGAIGRAFADAFTAAFEQIKAFYNQLPGWLRSALQGAANVGSAVTGAVQSALGKVGVAFGEAAETLNRAFTPPAIEQGGGGGRQFRVGDVIDASTVEGGKVGPGAKSAGKVGPGAKSAGKGEAEKQLERQLEAQRKLGIEANNALIQSQQKLEASKSETELQDLMLKTEEQRTRINQKYGKLLDNQVEKSNMLILLEARRNELAANSNNFAESMGRLMGKVEEKATAIEQALAGAGDIIGNQLRGAIDGLIDGTADWNEVLNSTLKQLASFFLNFGLNTLTSGLAGTDGVGFFSKLFGGGRASGGTVRGGTSYLVGERGPELFVPRSSGSIIANDNLPGNNVNVVVNVDAKGTDVQGNDKNATQLGRVLSAAVQSELIKQQRPGGILAR